MCRSDLLIRSRTCRAVPPTSPGAANSQAMVYQTNILLMRKLNHWRLSVLTSMKKKTLPLVHILLATAICRYCPKHNRLFLILECSCCSAPPPPPQTESWQLCIPRTPLAAWTPLLELLFSSQDKMLSASLTWTRPAGTVWWHTLVQWGKRPLIPV